MESDYKENSDKKTTYKLEELNNIPESPGIYFMKDKEDRYYAKFTALEKYISQMSAQSSWISQQFNNTSW